MKDAAEYEQLNTRKAEVWIDLGCQVLVKGKKGQIMAAMHEESFCLVTVSFSICHCRSPLWAAVKLHWLPPVRDSCNREQKGSSIVN